MNAFRRVPFERLPEHPRRDHPFLRLPLRDVVVGSRPFGRVCIRYRELGDGPPLLLVHGLMTTGYSFRHVVTALSREYRVVVPDLVGCGRSDKPDLPYDAPRVAELIGETMDALEITGCPVVGNSMGGYLCMRLALDRPDAMRRLVNIHSPGLLTPRMSALAAAWRVPGTGALLDRLVAADPQRWVWRNVHYWDEGEKSREEVEEYGAPLTTRAGRRAFARYLAETLAPRHMRTFEADLATWGFPVPLLLVYARRDPMVPPDIGARLARRVPDADLVWLEETSHFMHAETPERTLAAILPFLRQRGGTVRPAAV